MKIKSEENELCLAIAHARCPKRACGGVIVSPLRKISFARCFQYGSLARRNVIEANEFLLYGNAIYYTNLRARARQLSTRPTGEISRKREKS